ncbi:MAG: hypothetical protein IT469_00805 [Pseudomonadales bacterium]|nr:hypothetical protein [Pseudomonadales bacterium]
MAAAVAIRNRYGIVTGSSTRKWVMNGTDIDPSGIEGQDDLFHSMQDKRRVVIDMEARRRLEDRLEQRRLERMIRDYDFDLDRD